MQYLIAFLNVLGVNEKFDQAVKEKVDFELHADDNTQSFQM